MFWWISKIGFSQTLFLEGSQQESGPSTEREEQESDILTSQKLPSEKPLQFAAVQDIHLRDFESALVYGILGSEVRAVI